MTDGRPVLDVTVSVTVPWRLFEDFDDNEIEVLDKIKKDEVLVAYIDLFTERLRCLFPARWQAEVLRDGL